MLVPTDRELVLAAQRGEAPALGALLERHRARLTAEAMRLLGDRAAAEDAVQDTAIVALRRIGDLRDPAAIRPWLLTILRNACRMTWRGAVAPTPLDEMLVAADGPTPEQRLERAATRDWLWTALRDLPEPVRATVMLRHFGTWSSYTEIAAVLGVPVGTVRSRLHLARGRLAEALATSAEAVHDDARAAHERAAAEFRAAAAELNDGERCDAMCDVYAEDVVARLPSARAQGREAVRASLQEDLDAGIRMTITRVLTSGTVTIVEAALLSPPDDPLHCPPATCQVHLRPDGRTSAVRLHFTRQKSANAPTPQAA